MAKKELKKAGGDSGVAPSGFSSQSCSVASNEGHPVRGTPFHAITTETPHPYNPFSHPTCPRNDSTSRSPPQTANSPQTSDQPLATPARTQTHWGYADRNRNNFPFDMQATNLVILGAQMTNMTELTHVRQKARKGEGRVSSCSPRGHPRKASSEF